MLTISELEKQITRLEYQLQYKPKLVVQTNDGMRTELTEFGEKSKTIINSYIMALKQEVAELRERGEHCPELVVS